MAHLLKQRICKFLVASSLFKNFQLSIFHNVDNILAGCNQGYVSRISLLGRLTTDCTQESSKVPFGKAKNCQLLYCTLVFCKMLNVLHNEEEEVEKSVIGIKNFRDVSSYRDGAAAVIILHSLISFAGIQSSDILVNTRFFVELTNAALIVQQKELEGR